MAFLLIGLMSCNEVTSNFSSDDIQGTHLTEINIQYWDMFEGVTLDTIVDDEVLISVINDSTIQVFIDSLYQLDQLKLGEEQDCRFVYEWRSGGNNFIDSFYDYCTSSYNYNSRMGGFGSAVYINFTLEI